MRHLLLAALAATAIATPALAAEAHDESYQCGAAMLFYWAGSNEVVYVANNTNYNLTDTKVDANSFAGHVSGAPITVAFDRKAKKLVVTTSGKPATFTCTARPADTNVNAL